MQDFFRSFSQDPKEDDGVSLPKQIIDMMEFDEGGFSHSPDENKDYEESATLEYTFINTEGEDTSSFFTPENKSTSKAFPEEGIDYNFMQSVKLLVFKEVTRKLQDILKKENLQAIIRNEVSNNIEKVINENKYMINDIIANYLEKEFLIQIVEEKVKDILKNKVSISFKDD